MSTQAARHKATRHQSAQQARAQQQVDLGLRHAQAQRWSEARTAFAEAARLAPREVGVWIFLARASNQLGDAAAVEAAAVRALELDPTSTAAWGLLCFAVTRQGRAAEAADRVTPLLTEAMDDPALWLDAGYASYEAGRYEEALDRYSKAAICQPDLLLAHLGMGDALDQLALPEAAYECFRTAALLAPQRAELRARLIFKALQAARWEHLDEDIQVLNECSAQCNDDELPIAFDDLLIPGRTAAQHRHSAAAYFRRFTQHIQPLPAPTPGSAAATQNQRIRVGYLSSDFYEHATSHLIVQILEQHDRSRFAVTLYSYGPDDGSRTRRRVSLAAERFCDVRKLGAREIAQKIRDDGIDVLIDLKGFTEGARHEVMAFKPVPVQVSWLGFPGTMGSAAYDYIITDQTVTPESAAADYDEQFAYLPDTYQPNDRERPLHAAPPRAACGLPDHVLVLACFNNAQKITPQLFDVWCQLLNELPHSVLWLLDANAHFKNNLRQHAQRRGITAERLIFAPKVPLHQHLARLRNADLVLDTLPYNAHTTASDALWAGVPVVTCMGPTFASRVAASLLRAAGLPQLVTENLDDYRALVLHLARVPEHLQTLRAELEAKRMSCALFDSLRFTRALEELYERMQAKQRRGEPPALLAPIDTQELARRVTERPAIKRDLVYDDAMATIAGIDATFNLLKQAGQQQLLAPAQQAQMLQRRADALLRLQRVAEALNDLQQAIKLMPDDSTLKQRVDELAKQVPPAANPPAAAVEPVTVLASTAATSVTANLSDADTVLTLASARLPSAPCLSICIPTCHRAALLDLLLQSLAKELAQAPFEFEVLISDNASPDHTWQVIEKHLPHLPIRAYRQPRNLGGGPSFQYIATESRGRYVCYVADDDFLLGQQLISTLARLEVEPQIGLVYAPWQLYDRVDAKVVDQFYRLPQDIRIKQGDHAGLLSTILKHQVWPEIAIVRRDLLHKVRPRFDEHAFFAFVQIADYLSCTDVLLAAKPFYAFVTRHTRDGVHHNAGHVEAETSWDRYRGGLEYLLGRALKQLPAKSHAELLAGINQFIAERLTVAVRLRLVQRRDSVGTYYLAARARALGAEKLLPAPMEQLAWAAALSFVATDAELTRGKSVLVGLGKFEPMEQQHLRGLCKLQVKFASNLIVLNELRDALLLVRDVEIDAARLEELAKRNVLIVHTADLALRFC